MAKYNRNPFVGLFTKILGNIFDVKVLVVAAGSISIFVSTCNHSATIKKTEEISAKQDTVKKTSIRPDVDTLKKEVREMRKIIDYIATEKKHR